jgi:uncharacterized membrane protein YdjX (TVP38/TMEM64 family)
VNVRARLALLAAALTALFVVFGVLRVVSREDVEGWIDPLGSWGAPAYAVLSAVLGCLLVPGPLLAAVSGALFGTWLGFAVTLVSAVLSALLGLAIGRGTGRVRAPDVVQRQGLLVVVVQRLLPGLPDAPFNYVAGSLGIRAWHIALGTFIGVAPRALAYTAIGDWAWN